MCMCSGSVYFLNRDVTYYRYVGRGLQTVLLEDMKALLNCFSQAAEYGLEIIINKNIFK